MKAKTGKPDKTGEVWQIRSRHHKPSILSH